MPILTDQERIGTTVAQKYRLDAILGRGGMGVVFRGTHTWTNREVAVKLLNHEFAHDATVVQRFLQEARAAAVLKHPNVVDVLDMGSDPDGAVYLVLEMLSGESLGAVIERQHGVPPRELFAWLAPVMGALASAHARGIVHRDLKPENIFLHQSETGDLVPKLLDFGIAKVRDANGPRATTTGAVMGTPYYMSPEQAAGKSDVGPQADIWSMGVVWFEALTGALPYDGPNITAVLTAIALGERRALRDVAPQLPAELIAVVERALVPDRTVRYAHMHEFIAALATALGVSVPERGLSIPSPAMSASHTRPPAAPGVAGAVSTAVEPVAPTVAAWNGTIRVAGSRSRVPVIAGALVALLGVSAGATILWRRTTAPAASSATRVPVAAQTVAPPAIEHASGIAPVVPIAPIVPAVLADAATAGAVIAPPVEHPTTRGRAPHGHAAGETTHNDTPRNATTPTEPHGRAHGPTIAPEF